MYLGYRFLIIFSVLLFHFYTPCIFYTQIQYKDGKGNKRKWKDNKGKDKEKRKISIKVDKGRRKQGDTAPTSGSEKLNIVEKRISFFRPSHWPI